MNGIGRALFGGIRRNFFLWLKGGVEKFFALNFRLLIHLAMRRSGNLRMQGKWEEAAQEMSEVVGLDYSDFENPAQAYEKIRKRLAELDPDTAALFFMQLTTFLVDEKKQRWVAAVHELDAGLCPDDYAKDEVLRQKMMERSLILSSEVSGLYWIRLANVLGLAERSKEELRVLESLLSLGEADYLDRERLHSVLAEGRAESQIWFEMGIQVLAACLGNIGRFSESIAVVEAAMGLMPADYTDSAVLRSKLGSIVVPEALERVAGIGLRTLLAESLGRQGRRAEAVVCQEASFGIESSDYRDGTVLSAKIEAARDGLPPECSTWEVITFLHSLIGACQFEAALAVLEADLGLDLESTNNENLSLAVRQRLASIPENIGGFYLGLMAFALETAGRPEQGAALLALDSGLFGTDWEDSSALAEILQDRLGDLAESTQNVYVGFLESALVASGEERRAALLLDVYLRGIAAIDKRPTDPSLMAMSCHFHSSWLAWWGTNGSKRPIALCRDLVPYLRQTLSEQGTTLRDREKFILSVSELRLHIIQTALYWSGQIQKPAAATELRRMAFLWDLELSQRLLIERFLLTDIEPAKEGSPLLPFFWPLDGEAPQSGSHRPDSVEELGTLGFLDGEREHLMKPILKQEGELTPAAKSLEELARIGLEEGVLANSLGITGLLLRATFDSEGRLVWGALRSAESRLVLVASGMGEGGDLQRLRWEAARHDFATGFLRWRNKIRRSTNKYLASVGSGPLEKALRLLAEAVEHGRDLQGVVEDLSADLQRRDLDSMLRLFRFLTWPLIEGGPDLNAKKALRFALSFVENIEEEGRLRSALDALTEDYLRRVSEVWELSALEPFLTSDTDLVFQGDDALHAVPVAWMPLRERRPLYQWVRTLRASLSPPLDTLLEQVNRGPANEDGKHRLLSVSYLGDDDPAQGSAKWLHRGHFHLAERFGAEIVAGANQETGTVGSIRSALEQYGSFDTAAILGHGDFDKAGIVLGGESGEEQLWQGQGCDFSGVDWLLLVSCSIGRASRTGDLDVEGFCVQLAVHRARSILACRWPVHAGEAAAFANEAVRQYLELRDQAAPRATALAATRNEICEGENPLVGLNTAAAFELYGIG